MEFGILVLTGKGPEVPKAPHLDKSPMCRNILVQMDVKKSGEDIHAMFRVSSGI